MDLMSAADEVYALRPEEFVGRRDALAAEARAVGDRVLAADIKKLTKPTMAAWVANLLVRRRPEQVDEVLGLGAALREAQAAMAGDQLRDLGRQRRRLTSAVTREARRLASELGQHVADPVAAQVEETLHAAMVDESAADALRTGMLVRPLTVAGVEGVDVSGVVAVLGAAGAPAVRRTPPPARRPDLSVVADDSRALEDAELELRAASAALREAERLRDKAGRKVQKREARGLQLQAELDELRLRVAALEQRVEDNEADLADAEASRDERSAAVDQARAAAERAEAALRRLRRRG